MLTFYNADRTGIKREGETAELGWASGCQPRLQHISMATVSSPVMFAADEMLSVEPGADGGSDLDLHTSRLSEEKSSSGAVTNGENEDFENSDGNDDDEEEDDDEALGGSEDEDLMDSDADDVDDENDASSSGNLQVDTQNVGGGAREQPKGPNGGGVFSPNKPLRIRDPVEWLVPMNKDGVGRPTRYSRVATLFCHYAPGICDPRPVPEWEETLGSPEAKHDGKASYQASFLPWLT